MAITHPPGDERRPPAESGTVLEFPEGAKGEERRRRMAPGDRRSMILEPSVSALDLLETHDPALDLATIAVAPAAP